MDTEKDFKELQKLGTIDAFQDWSPPWAAKSTQSRWAHLFDGWDCGKYLYPTWSCHVYRNLQNQGKFMYTRENVLSFIKLIEAGVLELGKQRLVEKPPLGRWLEAFKATEESNHSKQTRLRLGYRGYQLRRDEHESYGVRGWGVRPCCCPQLPPLVDKMGSR